MKAEIITLHYIWHYGSLLQTYATCKVFEKIGIETEVIDYVRPNADENEEIKAQILEVMTSEPKAIKELQAENESLAEYTNQKLSALLKQLVGENKVERIEEKRVAKFKKVVDNQ